MLGRHGFVGRAANVAAFKPSFPVAGAMDPVAWLLDPADPAVRARALVDLLGRAPDDPDVKAARAETAERGSAARVLAGLAVPDEARALYVPKYGATFHRVVALAEMGVTTDEPRAAAALEALLTRYAKDDGGFGNPARPGPGHLCVTGNLARAAILMGEADHPRVRNALDWLVERQDADGGWHCFPNEEKGGTLDAWEALGAFAALPEPRRSARVRESAARGVAFLLERQLGARAGHAPWLRFHFPRHYYYDVLVGLDLATTLGDPRDARLGPALDLLRAKRGPDGLWRHEKDHPDLAEGDDYTPHPPGLPIAPLQVEPEGAPSRWVTLAAMRVLRRVEGRL